MEEWKRRMDGISALAWKFSSYSPSSFSSASSLVNGDAIFQAHEAIPEISNQSQERWDLLVDLHFRVFWKVIGLEI